LIQEEDDIKRFNVGIVQQIFLNQGFTTEEFTGAYNALIMESKIKCNNETMWLTE
jgi:hypothetical protein